MGRGRQPGAEGKKGEHRTPAGPKDRTDKGSSLTKDTPRDAATNDLRSHSHNFAYTTFKMYSLSNSLRELRIANCTSDHFTLHIAHCK